MSELTSRFKYKARPDTPPGKCIVCGAVDRPVVEFGEEIEWADRAYAPAMFCVTCITEAAKGFPQEEGEKTYTRAELFEQGRKMKAEIKHELQLFIDNGLICSNPSYGIHGDADSVLEQTESENATGIEPKFLAGKSGAGKASVETASPISFERSDDVPSDSSDGRSPLFG